MIDIKVFGKEAYWYCESCNARKQVRQYHLQEKHLDKTGDSAEIFILKHALCQNIVPMFRDQITINMIRAAYNLVKLSNM